MPRKKGFKLSSEQKAKMLQGRKAAKVKASEGMIIGQEKVVKIKKADPQIIGYGMDKNDKFPYPIFSSEKDFYCGKVYKTVSEAKEARK